MAGGELVHLDGRPVPVEVRGHLPEAVARVLVPEIAGSIARTIAAATRAVISVIIIEASGFAGDLTVELQTIVQETRVRTRIAKFEVTAREFSNALLDARVASYDDDVRERLLSTLREAMDIEFLRVLRA